jgi:plastocyanin domain-containing protein
MADDIGTKECIVSMKNTTSLMFVILILIVGGIFLFAKGEAKQEITGNAIANNDIQKITLSIKNYNYYPNTIKVKEGIPVRINLDESVVGCYRSFTIREFGISKYLKTPNDYVEFTPTRKGTYTFACSMGMGTGKIIVE